MLEVEQLRGEMREYAEGSRGHLRISAWYHAEPEIALFLQEFLAENTLVEISILELPTWDALDQLRARQLDLALIVVTKGLDLTGVDHCVVKTEPYVLVTAPADPLASRASVEVSELPGLPFIATRDGTALRRCLDRAFAEIAEPPRIVIETNELAATINFVSIGLGNAILTRSIAEHVGLPVSLIPLAGNSPFVLAAAWTAAPHNRLVEEAIGLITSRISPVEDATAM